MISLPHGQPYQSGADITTKWKIEEFEYFQYLDRDRLPTVDLLVRAAAVLMALLISAWGRDRLCMMRLQVKWGNVPELAAIGFDCCIHFLLYHWEVSVKK